MRFLNYSFGIILLSFVMCLLCGCPDPPPTPSNTLQVVGLELDGKDIALDAFLVTQEGVSLRPSVRISFDESVELSEVEQYVSLAFLGGDKVGVSITQEDAKTFVLSVSSALKTSANYVLLVSKGLESKLGGVTYTLSDALTFNFITRGLNAEASLTVLYESDTISSLNNKFNLVVDTSVDLSKVPLLLGVSSGSSLLLDNQELKTAANAYSGTIDFSNKNVRSLTVVSEDEEGRKEYLIEVNQKRSSSKSITSFAFPSVLNSSLKEDVLGVIDEGDKTINVIVPADVDISTLIPIITHTGKELVPADRAATNFSVPFDYTVKAEDNSTSAYTVTVNKLASENAVVHFEVNGGSSLADTTIVKGVQIPSPRAIIRAGYKFDGWYVDASFSSLYDFNSVVNDNLTLYAKWQRVYSVSFNSNGGSDVSSVTVDSAGVFDIPSPPSRFDFNFGGWHSDVGLENAYDFGQGVLRDITLYAKWVAKDMEGIVTLRKIPNDLDKYDQLSQEVFSVYEAGDSVEAIYVTVSGSGSRDGSSWSNAAAGDGDGLKSVIDGISGTNASKMYVVLVAGGLYTPSATLSMKNKVAIIGGWAEAGSFERPSLAVTRIDGAKNKRLFINQNLSNLALMHSVMMQHGKTSSVGGGMANNNSSVTLYYCTFSDNEALVGGGMWNTNSSVRAYYCIFLNNRSISSGGIYEKLCHSMYNYCTFMGNSTDSDGGAINAYESKISVLNSTFTANSSGRAGGALAFSGNGASNRGNFANCIFWGNTATVGNEIYIYDTINNEQHLSIYNSVVEGGITGSSDNPQGTGIFKSGLGSIDLQYRSIDSTNPNLGSLGDNGGAVQTVSIGSGSSAVDLGLYVQRSGDTYYYSSDGTSWYSDVSLETVASPPADAEKLYGRDARGYLYTGRPDAGAYELGASAP